MLSRFSDAVLQSVRLFRMKKTTRSIDFQWNVRYVHDVDAVEIVKVKSSQVESDEGSLWSLFSKEHEGALSMYLKGSAAFSSIPV